MLTLHTLESEFALFTRRVSEYIHAFEYQAFYDDALHHYDALFQRYLEIIERTPVLTFLPYALAGLLIVLLMIPRFNTPTDSGHLHALVKILVPARDARALPSLPHTFDGRKQTITLPSSHLIKYIASGHAELRQTAPTLYTLFKESASIDGWRILLDAEPSRLKVMAWLVKQKILWRPSLSQDVTVFTKVPDLLFLDNIPQPHFRSIIPRSLNSGTTVIEFTSISPNVAWLSRDFLLCAIPLAYRSYPRARLTTPLLTSLSDVLGIVYPIAQIDSVRNVSRQYAAMLVGMELDLAEDASKRARFVKENGMAAWREERLWLSWEAALLTSGRMDRWIVMLRKL